MHSVQANRWPLTSKYLEELETELCCKQCLKPVVSPKTCSSCQHFFCQSCVNTNKCPACGVVTNAKDIYYDVFVQNLATYVANMKESLQLLQAEHSVPPADPNKLCNISDTIRKSLVSDRSFNFVSEELLYGSPPELEPEVPMRAVKEPKKKLGRTRVEKLSEKKSTGALKRFLDGSLKNCKDPSADSHPKFPKASTSANAFKTSREDSDLKFSEILSEKNVPNGTSTRDTKTVSKDDTPERELQRNWTLNPALITPEKNWKQTKCCASLTKKVLCTAKKVANKRNKKGETPLQVASKKGKLKQVQSLIADGANPNVKDNFGWTPLHDAIQYSHMEVAKELLEKGGAMVNTPGGDNFTPLHKAVALNLFEGIKVLLEWGANPKLVDVYGNTPVDYSQSDEVTKMLENHSADLTKCSLMCPILEDYELEEVRAIFIGDGLSKNNQKLVVYLSGLLPGSKVAHALTSDVTHIVVTADNGTCNASMTVLTGILTGRHIVSVEWIQHSIKIRSIQHQHSPPVKSTKSYPFVKGILKAKMCLRKQLPSLFSGMHFAMSSSCRNLNYDNLKKDDIAHLVSLGNGQYLSREPDPEAIPYSEKTVPFYANNFVTELTGLDIDHPLKNCSHVILYHYDDPKSLTQRPDTNFIRYNMGHFKSLPLTWFVGCIESFTLLDPSPFIK